MNIITYEASVFCTECNPTLDLETVDTGSHSMHHEADTPLSCDKCHTFLENALTEDGYAYVHQAVIRFLSGAGGKRDVLTEWIDFYDIDLDELMNQVED